MLLDGPAPHDILRILGVEKLTEYFVTEVQEVYDFKSGNKWQTYRNYCETNVKGLR